jgi:hypothetical protein
MNTLKLHKGLSKAFQRAAVESLQYVHASVGEKGTPKKFNYWEWAEKNALSENSVMVRAPYLFDQQNRPAQIMCWQPLHKEITSFAVTRNVLFNGKEYVPGQSFFPDVDRLFSLHDLLSFYPVDLSESPTKDENIASYKLPVYFPFPFRREFGEQRKFCLYVKNKANFNSLRFSLTPTFSSENNFSNYWALEIECGALYGQVDYSFLRFEGKLTSIFSRAMAFFSLLSNNPEAAWNSLDNYSSKISQRERLFVQKNHKSCFYYGELAFAPVDKQMEEFNKVSTHLFQHFCLLYSFVGPQISKK